MHTTSFTITTAVCTPCVYSCQLQKIVTHDALQYQQDNDREYEILLQIMDYLMIVRYYFLQRYILHAVLNNLAR